MKRKSFPHVFFAVATIATSIFSFSVPSQASEYEYLYELDKLAKQQDLESYSDHLSDSKKLKNGRMYCAIMEDGSIKDIYSAFKETIQNMLQQGYSDRQIDIFTAVQITILHASVKELCPAYGYKFNKIIEALESAKKQQPLRRQSKGNLKV